MSFGGGAFHFFEFSHQVGLVVQAPGGVHDYHVDVARSSGGNRVVDHSRRVGAGLLLHDFGTGALGPDAELFDGRGAEGVARAQQNAGTLLTQAVG